MAQHLSDNRSDQNEITQSIFKYYIRNSNQQKIGCGRGINIEVIEQYLYDSFFSANIFRLLKSKTFKMTNYVDFI
jgi:hypothetical protein